MNKQNIGILNYGMGNLHSVGKALQHVASDSNIIISEQAEVLASCDRLVFPGVGAMSACLEQFKSQGFAQLLDEALKSKPVLAICVGMQALFDYSSEHGGAHGLSYMPGEFRHFNEVVSLGDKVPHMGWNEVSQTQTHPMWQGIPNNSRFYFVHSYYLQASEYQVGACEYGAKFVAAVAKDNLFATQFHPEKSQHCGLKLLENFTTWNPI